MGVRQLLDRSQGGLVLKPKDARESVSGFTLVELMIAVTVTGILLVLGVPTLRGVVENTRIRANAESFKYGLDLARNDAIRLNTSVEFAWTPTGWVVRIPADDDSGPVQHSGTGSEASRQVTFTLTPADADRITFDSLGNTLATNPSDGSTPLTQVEVESVNPPSISGYRPMRVQVLAGGTTRLCDPAVDADDPRVCM